MRVVVVGATGNVGTSVLHALLRDPQIESIVGVARRAPRVSFAKTKWVCADVTRDDLVPHFAGADAVIALAWLIQPSRDLATLRATNVDGNARIFDAVARAGVPALAYASSVGAYSPGPKDRRVDESWPTEGIESSISSSASTRTSAPFACGRDSSSSARRRPRSAATSPVRFCRIRWCAVS